MLKKGAISAPTSHFPNESDGGLLKSLAPQDPSNINVTSQNPTTTKAPVIWSLFLDKIIQGSLVLSDMSLSWMSWVSQLWRVIIIGTMSQNHYLSLKTKLCHIFFLFCISMYRGLHRGWGDSARGGGGSLYWNSSKEISMSIFCLPLRLVAPPNHFQRQHAESLTVCLLLGF